MIRLILHYNGFKLLFLKYFCKIIGLARYKLISQMEVIGKNFLVAAHIPNLLFALPIDIIFYKPITLLETLTKLGENVSSSSFSPRKTNIQISVRLHLKWIFRTISEIIK